MVVTRRYVRIPGRFIAQGNLIPLPESVSDTEASLLEPFSCVVNGVRAARVELGDTVVDLRCRPDRADARHALPSAGAAELIVVDPLDDRLAKALELGCDVTLNPAEEDIPARVREDTGGRGADVVITACPIACGPGRGGAVTGPLRSPLFVWWTAQWRWPVALDTNAIHYGNLIVTGTTGGSVEDYRIALRLVAGKRVDLTRVVSHVFGARAICDRHTTRRWREPEARSYCVAE